LKVDIAEHKKITGEHD